jgi:predicted nuclease of predicted toxin-antitoxin system
LIGGQLALTFFLDEGVPDSVAQVIRDSSHEAMLLRQSAVARGSPDQVVCAFAEATDAILVAIDGDMKRIAQGHGAGAGRFRSLNLLKLSCAEPDAAQRVREAMSLIEHEWQIEPIQQSLFIVST